MKGIGTLMKTTAAAATAALTATPPATAGGAEPFELTEAWKTRIEAIAPATPAVAPSKKHRALLFSRMTGYRHWVTPHTAAVVKILGEKSGAYSALASDDIENLAPENIKQFDLIVLNNTCSDRQKRDLFWDATKDKNRAAMLEKSLIDHVAAGAGLVCIHGAIVMQNNSPAFSRMVGGSFDRHPRQQEVVCRPVEPDHPLVKPFQGKAFVHLDEPYLFKNTYTNANFRPLLEMDVSKLQGYTDNGVRRYVAWIKKHGQGRVFYCSPSHNAQSFERPELLRFILNGIQYAAGDLVCDDTPPANDR